MSSFRFVPPSKLQDLKCFRNDPQVYVVSKEYGTKEVTLLLKEISGRSPDSILEDFDIFYGVLSNFMSLEKKSRMEAWRISLKSISALISDFSSLDISGSESFEKRQNCNVLKMHVFVFCCLLELFEDIDMKQTSEIEAQNVGKGKTKAKKNSDHFDWSRDREKGVELLLRLFSLSLNQLFDPPIVEEEFVNCITKCCWKILENPNAIKNKPLCLNLFHILGIAVDKHRQSLGFCVKLIQLLQNKEQLVATLAHLVQLVVTEHNQRFLINELFVEVSRIDCRELARDSTGTKAISSFVAELAERCPNEVLSSSLSSVLSFLDEDAYMMRNASLSVIGTLISTVLSGDEMDSKYKDVRDTLLEKLEEHIHDVNAYSRGRALQVWLKLCDEGKIPITRLETLIPMVIGRLNDKSCYVRKNSVQFLTSFLKYNPFAAKLPLQTLQETYNKEKERLTAMLERVKQSNVDEEMAVEEDLGDSWNRLEPEVVVYCNEVDLASTAENEDSEVPESPNSATNEDSYETILCDSSDFNALAKKFKSLMCEHNFKSAFDLLRQMLDKWPTHPLLNVEDIEIAMSEEEGSNDISEPLPEMVKRCKRLFLEKESSKKSDLDLNNKSVVKTMETVVSGIIESSQRLTTTVTVCRDSCSDQDLVEETNKQQILVKYLGDCVKFAKEIRSAIPIVCSLLKSQNVTDIQEAMSFFVTAYEFGVEGALLGVRTMLPLVFSQEAAVKEGVLNAYRNIYLLSSQLNELNTRTRAVAVVKSLTELVSGATIGEEISLEELLKRFMASGDIEESYIKVMWERFAMMIPNTSPEESRIAILLLAMIANSNPEIIRKNLDTLIDVLLSERAFSDLLLVTNICVALRKAVVNQGKLDLHEQPYRFPQTHKLFSSLSDILVKSLRDLNSLNWLSMCDEVLKVIFLLAEYPMSICERIVYRLMKEILENCSVNPPSLSNGNITENMEENATIETQSEATTESATQPSQGVETKEINSEVLARFVTFVGNLTLNTLIHLEVNIFTELKIRVALKDEKNKRKSALNPTKTPRVRRSMTPRTPAGDNLEEEIGLAGSGAIEDVEAEFITKLCDNEIVEKLGRHENLLARLSHVIVAIASDPTRFPDAILRAAATYALAKFMAVSEKFCDRHLQLFFTILEKTSEPLIRANAIIAVGDLCIRFPNLLDPWTTQLYMPLRDRDVVVRTNAVKVLSRLILSDMIKVKGQISEMAMLIVDEDKALSSMAQLFFIELGKKQNAVYNVLPDIISHLSEDEDGVDEEQFRVIMKYLLKFVGKERQIICLVEKLCQRFRSTTNERQWRDLAFCLSLLSFSEKSISKLHENLVCFADKLCNDVIYDSMVHIIVSCRKMPNIKNETKELLDDFEKKMIECRNKGVNDDENEFREAIRTSIIISSVSKRQGTKSASLQKTKNQSTRKNQSKSARKAIKFSEDDEDDFVRPSTSRDADNRDRVRRVRKAKIAQLFSSSSEEDD